MGNSVAGSDDVDLEQIARQMNPGAQKYTVATPPKTVTRESALEKLGRLRERLASNSSNLASMNEAKTRLLIIDEILIALGWPKESFNPEEPAGGAGYTDYLLTVDGNPRLVVEAKRTGATFSSTKKHTRTTYTLSYLRSAFGARLTEVLEQGEKYAREHGLPHVLLTNGHVWLLAQVIPAPGQNAEDCKCYYFGDLLSEDGNFELFWELLSYDSVASDRMTENMAELNVHEADFSANPHGELGDFTWKKSLDNDSFLEDFYYLFFDEIVDSARRNMLEHCFVTNARLDQYEGNLKRVLRDTAPTFLEDATEITPENRDAILAGSLGDQRGRVVLVTGSVGCGKSTFVTKVLVEARQGSSTQAVLIDLIDENEAPAHQIQEILWNRVLAEWKKTQADSLKYEELKNIFHAELEALKAGPEARVFASSPDEFEKAEAAQLRRLSDSAETFLSRCFRYYRKQRGIGVVVFLDNVDRASEEFQKTTYFFAHRLARETGATVIVPMREMTFFRGKAGGFLDIRSSDAVFHLSAPDLVQVVSKRIKYVQDHLSDDHRYREWRRRKDADAFIAAFRDRAEEVKRSLLLSNAGKRIIGLLSALAWHDVRAFLAYLKQVHAGLGSTEWRPADVSASLQVSGANGAPARIPNLFRPPYVAFPCFFVKARILAALLYSITPDRVRQGVKLGELFRILRVYGYHDRWVRKAIEELVQERMLECLEAPAAAEYTRTYSLSDIDSFRPSPLGVAVFESIQFEKSYPALIGNDLAFHSQDLYKDYVQSIKDVTGAIGSADLEVEGLNLLLESDAPSIVLTYLSRMFAVEKPLVELAKYAPAVSAIEARLEEALRRIGITTGAGQTAASAEVKPDVFGRANQRSRASEDTTQLELLGGTTKRPAQAPLEAGESPVKCSDKIRSVKIGTSTSAPAIFWALVHIRATGHSEATGAEITRIVNEHVFSDQEKRESTNISRLLRSDSLRAQPWLAVKGTKGAWSYGLCEGWEDEWRRIFGEEPPTGA